MRVELGREWQSGVNAFKWALYSYSFELFIEPFVVQMHSCNSRLCLEQSQRQLQKQVLLRNEQSQI